MIAARCPGASCSTNGIRFCFYPGTSAQAGDAGREHLDSELDLKTKSGGRRVEVLSWSESQQEGREKACLPSYSSLIFSSTRCKCKPDSLQFCSPFRNHPVHFHSPPPRPQTLSGTSFFPHNTCTLISQALERQDRKPNPSLWNAGLHLPLQKWQ